MSLGPILFGAPWALAALIALPALFWILRATPPAPARTMFPPVRLLLGLRTEEQSRKRAPLWLVLFRALAAALLILAFARPSLAPSAAESAEGGRTLIVIDDGWTSAPFWSETRQAAIASINEAERMRAPVFVLLTAPAARPRDPAEAMTAADARGRIGRLEPKPWRPDRGDAAQRLARTDLRFDRIVWISDGLDDPGARSLAEVLEQRGPVTARLPAQTARADLGPVTRRASWSGAPRAMMAGRPRHRAETTEGALRGRGALPAISSPRRRASAPPRSRAGRARAHRGRAERERGAALPRARPPFVGLVDPGGAGRQRFQVFYASARFSLMQACNAAIPRLSMRARNDGAADTNRIAPPEPPR